MGVATNVATSTDERAKALRALNEQYGKYLDALGKEQITLPNVADAYDRIVDSLLRQAVAKGLQDEIAKKIEETAKQIIALQKAQELRKQAENNVQGVVKKGETLNQALNKSYELQTRAVSDNVGAHQERFAIMQAEFNQETKNTDPIDELTNKLKLQLAPLLTLTTRVEDLGVSFGKTSEKAKKLTPLLPFFNTKIQTVSAVKLDFVPPTIPDVKATQEEIDGLTKLFKPIKIPVVPDTDFKASFKQLLKDIREGVKGLIFNDLINAFNAFFDAVSRGANAFKAFGELVKNVIRSIVTDLIKAIAYAGILSLLSGGKNAEGGLSYLGALKKVIGGFRASGGPVSNTKGYIVGENGPEFFMPSTSGMIIPNGGFGGSTSGLAGAFGEVVFRIGTRELIGSLALGNASQRRSF